MAKFCPIWSHCSPLILTGLVSRILIARRMLYTHPLSLSHHPLSLSLSLSLINLSLSLSDPLSTLFWRLSLPAASLTH